MKRLFDLMDVSKALTSAVAWAKSVRGPEAGILALWFFLLDLAFGWLCWYFDIESTLVWARGVQPTVMNSLSAQFLTWTPLILILIALVPTLMRQSLAQLAGKLQLIAALLFVVGMFDVQTDWPRTAAFFDLPVVWNIFAWAGPAQGLVWAASRLVFLFFATDGFEVIFIVSVVCTVILAMQTGKNPAVAARP